MSVPRSDAHDPYAVFRFAPFRWFVASLLAMVMAAQIQLVVVGWEIYQLTQDPLSLGLLGLSEVLPYLSVALYAGHVVDRQDRKKISLASPRRPARRRARPVHVSHSSSQYRHASGPSTSSSARAGWRGAFLQVARSALVAEVVPRELYTNAATWRSSTWQAGTVAGPALGGLLFAAFGARVTLGINLLFGVVALGTMLAVRHRPTAVTSGTVSVIRNMVEGLRYVRTQRVIVGALTLDLLAVFFGGVVAVLPIFASDILKVGADGFGTLQAAPGAGAVLMAFYIAHRKPFRHAGPVLLASVTVFGFAIIGFALSRTVRVVGAAARDQWRCRQRERRHSIDAHPGARATGNAGPSVVGERDFHRQLE